MKGYIQGLKRIQWLFSVGVLIAAVFLTAVGVWAMDKNSPSITEGEAGEAFAPRAKPKPLKDKIKTIVIDPGHGGHDSGCLGSSAQEKNVALAISLKLGKMIEQNFTDVKVIYTRKTDVFVELYRRAQIANEAHADLFICIHCNSGPKAAYGVETYVMGLHKTESNLGVAKRENESILMESDYKTNYDGYDPNSAEADIIFSLYQSAYLDHSLSFASKVQDQARGYAKRHDRKVRQAGFLVLWKTSMPSVLIETGFLTNTEEHNFLAAKKGQDLMAAAIYRAFIDYKSEIEGITYEDGLKTDTITDYKAKSGYIEIKDTRPGEADTTASQTKYIQVIDEPVKESQIPSGPVNTANDGIVYRVQFYSSPNKVALNSVKFKGLIDVFEYKATDNYRYTAGKYTKFSDAIKYQNTVRAKGFKDAFVIVFKDGKRLIGDDAKKYLK